MNDFSYQKVKDAEAEELEGEAHVAKVVEPVEHAAAEAGRGNKAKCELMLTIRVRNKASHFIKCKRLLINFGRVLHIYDNDRIFTPPTWEEINEAVSQIWAEYSLY